MTIFYQDGVRTWAGPWKVAVSLFLLERTGGRVCHVETVRGLSGAERDINCRDVIGSGMGVVAIADGRLGWLERIMRWGLVSAI